ncbi:MAG: SRPBCC domain-containing protein [Vicinamibacterales bacterium]
MTLTMPSLDQLTIHVSHDVHVRASIDATFDALLVQMGPGNETPDGKPLPMVLEPSPGGRWFRDLGAGHGHLWGHVQAIKRPSLLEIYGPLFMSAPVISNVQYRLTAVDGGTLMTFRHSAFGLVPESIRADLSRGWAPLVERIRLHAEGRSTTH